MEQNFEKEKKNGAMLQESEWESRVKMVQAVTTKAEQKVAAWLMEQSGQLGQMTLREVASGAGVGQPTVIRLLKKAGFSGWNDFLHMVWKEKKLLDEKYEIQLPAALSCMQEDIAVIREMAQHLNCPENCCIWDFQAVIIRICFTRKSVPDTWKRKISPLGFPCLERQRRLWMLFQQQN